jgi:hypothetical protein
VIQKRQNHTRLCLFGSIIATTGTACLVMRFQIGSACRVLEQSRVGVLQRVTQWYQRRVTFHHQLAHWCRATLHHQLAHWCRATLHHQLAHWCRATLHHQLTQPILKHIPQLSALITVTLRAPRTLYSLKKHRTLCSPKLHTKQPLDTWTCMKTADVAQHCALYLSTILCFLSRLPQTLPDHCRFTLHTLCAEAFLQQHKLTLVCSGPIVQYMRTTDMKRMQH